MAEDALDKALEDNPDGEKDEKKDTLPSDDKPKLEDQLTETTAKLEELEKSFKGQFGALKAEREQRQALQEENQQFKGRLDEISTTLKDAIARKSGTGEKETPEGIPVDIDEEGNATISQEFLSNLIATQIKPVEEKLGKVETAGTERDTRSTQERDAQKTIDGVIAENEDFPAAHSKLTRMISWVDERLIPKLEEDGHKTMPSVGRTLDILDGTEIESDFGKQFPGVSMDMIIRSQESKRDLRSVLKHLGEEKSDLKGKDDKKDEKIDLKNLKKIAEKGSNLGDVRNQKETRGLSLDQIASINTEDFLDLDDADITKIQRVLEQEEFTE